MDSIPVPRADDPTPLENEPNCWCVEDQNQVYIDAKMFHEKGLIDWLVTLECWVLAVSLHTFPELHKLLNRHNFDWMAQDWGSYSEDIVKEFYAS